MFKKSTETANPKSSFLLKYYINSLLESEINYLRDEIWVKNDLIKWLISSKSVQNPVSTPTSNTVNPKNLLKEIQKPKKNSNKNLVNKDLISMSLDTNKSNLTRTKISNCADTLDVRNYLLSLDTNKHQTYIDNKTAPKLLSRMPASLPPSPTTNIIGVRKWWISNKFKWKWKQIRWS